MNEAIITTTDGTAISIIILLFMLNVFIDFSKIATHVTIVNNISHDQEKKNLLPI